MKSPEMKTYFAEKTLVKAGIHKQGDLVVKNRSGHGRECNDF
jgi:hypothetical protein